ncbi:hypothetical protein, partial [Enterobacter ludwigii]
IDVRQSGGALQSVRSSANLNSVVRALNALGATPKMLKLGSPFSLRICR